MKPARLSMFALVMGVELWFAMVGVPAFGVVASGLALLLLGFRLGLVAEWFSLMSWLTDPKVFQTMLVQANDDAPLLLASWALASLWLAPIALGLGWLLIRPIRRRLQPMLRRS